MTAKKPKVSIVVLTFNALKMTKNQLKDLSSVDVKGLDVETILVDNGSSDRAEEALSNYKLPNMSFKFIQTGANLGVAGGNNPGMKDAIKRSADYVILMNNDLILSKDILTKLVSIAKKDDSIGLLSPKMYFAKGYEFHKDRYKKSELGNVFWYAGGIIDRGNVYSTHRGVDEVDVGQYERQEDTDIANGACVLVTRKLIEKIGYLNASLFLYWEDSDYSERARRAGFRVVYTPKTKLWHMISSSTGGSGSTTNDYFLTRNRLAFGFKYLSFRTKFALIRDSVRMMFKGRKWQKKGVVDFFLFQKGKGSWGRRK